MHHMQVRTGGTCWQDVTNTHMHSWRDEKSHGWFRFHFNALTKRSDSEGKKTDMFSVALVFY